MKLTRRGFLASAAVFSAAGHAPLFLKNTTAAEAQRPDRILVVVQLAGGNDGLNTVVPFEDDRYYRARPQLGIPKKDVLPIESGFGWHPSLSGLARLYGEGKLALVQGVGYPNPDRSHFRSMEIWHTASDSDETLTDGWLGRYFDNSCGGSPNPAAGLALMGEFPQAFHNKNGLGLAAADPARLGWQEAGAAGQEETVAALNQPAGETSQTLDFLRHTTQQALGGAEAMRKAAEKGGVRGRGYTRGLAHLDTVAGLIRGGLNTRVYYVSLGGFDTHANQAGQHGRLLQEASDALLRFQELLEQDGTADRVLALVFSEFGRRLEQNASGGTDHGAAAPLFLVGNGVKGGLHGESPNLGDLDRGDLRHTTDFRQVYAEILGGWMVTDAKAVLGRDFAPLHVIA